MAAEKINITIKIAERQYPLLVLPVDESKVRAAADKINATLKDLMSKYDGRDMQDYMAMYILIIMNQQLNEPPPLDTSSFQNHLSELEKQLDELIK